LGFRFSACEGRRSTGMYLTFQLTRCSSLP
jgi:hypothetical protein